MNARMRAIGAGVVGFLAMLMVVSQVVFWAGTSMGVVHEHCADLEGSTATRVDLDSGWTYIVFPPVFFANADPPGVCVRNSPLREGLAALGIWELPSPKEQVREHIAEQLQEDRQASGGS